MSMFFSFFLHYYYFSYFCNVLPPQRASRTDILGKTLRLTFYLRLTESRKFIIDRTVKAVAGAYGCMYATAWASTLLILDRWAMREPWLTG